MSTNLDRDARELIRLAKLAEHELPRNKARVRRGITLAVMSATATATATATAAQSTAPPAAALVAKGASAVGVAASVKAVASSATLVKLLSLVTAVSLVGAGVGHVYGQRQAEKQALTRPQLRPAPATPTATAVMPPPSKASSDASAPLPTVVESSPERPKTSVTSPRSPRGAAAVGKSAQSERSTAAAPPPRASVEQEPRSSTLSADLRILREAQQALNAGAPARTLQLLRGVQGSQLSAEKTALEVFALCAMGAQHEARGKAEQFRKIAPGSPLLPRVNAACKKP